MTQPSEVAVQAAQRRRQVFEMNAECTRLARRQAAVFLVAVVVASYFVSLFGPIDRENPLAYQLKEQFRLPVLIALGAVIWYLREVHRKLFKARGDLAEYDALPVRSNWPTIVVAVNSASAAVIAALLSR